MLAYAPPQRADGLSTGSGTRQDKGTPMGTKTATLSAAVVTLLLLFAGAPAQTSTAAGIAVPVLADIAPRARIIEPEGKDHGVVLMDRDRGKNVGNSVGEPRKNPSSHDGRGSDLGSIAYA